MNSKPESPKIIRTTLFTFLALLLGFLVITLRMIGPYLLAITMGGILALLVHPYYQKLKARIPFPKTSSFLTTLAILVLIVGPIFLFADLAVHQALSVGQALTSEQNFTFQEFTKRITQLKFSSLFIDNPVQFQMQVRSLIENLAKEVSTAILMGAASVPMILLQVALSLLSCFFLLLDGQNLLNWITNKIPLDTDVRHILLVSLKDTTLSVIWATVAAAAAQSLIILAAFIVLGIPAAFLGAGATFIFAWIPLLGSSPVWLSGAIYLYLKGSTWKWIIMIVLGLFTGIVDNLIRAWVLKGRTSIHPLVSLIAIFGGIHTFGITGIFLGPILTAVLIVLLDIWPAVGQRSGVLPKVQKETQKAA